MSSPGNAFFNLSACDLSAFPLGSLEELTLTEKTEVLQKMITYATFGGLMA
jgi:hypothetical protein